MTSQPASARPGGFPAPGTRLGGDRYVLEEVTRHTPFGALYRGTEASSGRSVSVHLLDPALVGAAGQALAEGVRAAAGLMSEHVARPLELASEGQTAFVVSEPCEGHTLRQLIERKRAAGGASFGAAGALNIVSQLCDALDAVHRAGPHGALGLDSVVVSQGGRVAVVDVGLAALAPALARAGRLGAQAAPEVVAGSAPSPAADVYALGAIAYELLVGAPPAPGCQRPSQAVPGLSPLADTFVATCMHRDPARRPQGAAQIKAAAHKALSGPTGQRSGAVPAQSGRRSLAQQIASPGAAPSSPASAPSGQISGVFDDPQERWLVSKGKLDYGPFTIADVVDQIRKGDILPGNILVDNDTGDRMPVQEHPLLGDLVEEARQRRDDERRARAEMESVKQEKRRGAALYAIIAAVVIGIGGSAYLLVTTLGSDDSDDSASIAALDEAKLDVKIRFPTAAEKKKRAKARRKKGRSGGGGGGWDDTLDLDLGSEGGGTERLDDSQINAVIQKHGGRLGRCLSSTGSRYAGIEFIVRGNGKVSHVRVNGETSGALYGCVRRAMMAMTFPSFDGPRTKATFDMSL